jgi:hypothetical protein
MTPESNHWQQFIQSLTDKGRAENAVEVQTRYSFTRKVAERDEYIPHIIDLGDTLFTKGGAS